MYKGKQVALVDAVQIPQMKEAGWSTKAGKNSKPVEDKPADNTTAKVEAAPKEEPVEETPEKKVAKKPGRKPVKKKLL